MASVVLVLVLVLAATVTMSAAAAAEEEEEAYHPVETKVDEPPEKPLTRYPVMGRALADGMECNPSSRVITASPISVDILARTYARSPYLSKRDHT